MKFTKMQGIGNDYVYVNCLCETVADPSAAARKVSDRHFGIGSDGLILIKPSEIADFEMDMYNADGSQGAMCGNGIRCVAKYVYDYGLTDKQEISISTKSGIKYLKLEVEGGKVKRVRVNMGQPILDPVQIPVVYDGERVQNMPIVVDGNTYAITCVSMGNPHCVMIVDSTEQVEIEKIGPLFEHNEIFPDRVNTEFIQILDDRTLRMRVWERGAGETMACGTGACAAAVACAMNGYTKRSVQVELLGGVLEIEWSEDDDCVYMTGPAEVVFDGEIEL